MQLKLHHIPIQLHNQVMHQLRYNLLQANAFFNKSFTEPTICYRKKGSIAGSAYLEYWQIQLNSEMLLENKLDFINEVIPHELAHLIAFKQYGKVKPHGKEWQFIMTEIFGCKANRTHAFKLPETVLQKRYYYYCQCQQHLLSAYRHLKVQKKKIQYTCRSCGQLLLLKEKVST